ncbi:hypothetical protein [Neorickettsia findlayensis]|uniref:Uncharacterized protein n=1 Tax=Neorickettsia findlayensis TaxID=2686014 RepID=A0A6P1G910_9RICK|nr:hypothetical protein [Neorickettsia findlayensis]QHD64936.1 hypothetical protein GP480_00400 [Neorickettsia findlayensis]
MRHFAWCLATQPGVEKDGILSYMNLPVKVWWAAVATMANAFSSEDFATYVRKQTRPHWGPGCMPTVLVEPPLTDHPVVPRSEQMRYFARCLAGAYRHGILPCMKVRATVCCGSEELHAAALEGVRDAVQERLQEGRGT